ncbi:hypothetical protein AC482_06565 [miscellaneous Crenarchaeota group-15 archaeon DG-45]|uniref:DUF362 domain-containing protein n=1 Tax=miscellaneous Crenarchaeota group-15 archaeon DG-45 TaxID=1685127 RepID=A0A0M0BLX9_9ARCH|nr:MAG: hypothetical protein AC482_06565 [miscellaneous Crenarchaeota group-15 archaeon DG-45]
MGDRGTTVTHESSMGAYERLLRDPPAGPEAPLRPRRPDAYSVDGRGVVAVVRSKSRVEGIRESLRLIGGVEPIMEGVEGEILIKPNCNTDDPFPRDTHPETVRAIAESLLSAGFPAERIIIGEISGRARGLPTRHTMRNLGITGVAEDLGLRISCFEEEGWVTVRPPGGGAWPDGIKIPRRVHEAGRVILTPIMRPHSNATFTISLKLAVGMIDAVGREWLHDGEAFYEKMVELNLAYSADLVVADATRIYVDSEAFHDVAEPGVIIAGSSRVAADAVSVALMKHYGAHGASDRPVMEHEQFTISEGLGLGSPRLDGFDLRTSNLAGDEGFDELVSRIRKELTG